MIGDPIIKIRKILKRFYRAPYCVPFWGWAEHWAILKNLLGDSIIDGNSKIEFFKIIKRTFEVKHVFGFESGEEAIFSVLTACEVKKPDHVVLPSFCCESVVKAVTRTGATPRFCDIGNDLNPGVEDILSVLDEKVKCIIFPHLFGNPGNIDKLIIELKKKERWSKTLVIDDAAQSFGGSIGGKLIGTFGEVGILSFGLGKILAATGGGLAITDSDKIAEKLKKLDCGKALKREKIKRIAYWLFLRRWRKYFLVIGPWILRLLAPTTLGTNKKPIELCNVDAAIALRQLNRLGKILEIRKNRKKRLDDLFNRFEPSVCGVFINKSERELVSVATKYVRLFNFAGHGNDIQEKYGTYLGLKGIEIQPLYTPMHHNPIYCQDQINLPKTEKCYKSLCQVPIEPSISDDEFDRVVEAVTEFLDQIRIADPDSVLV